MIKDLARAIEKIKGLPEDRQRFAAALLEQIASSSNIYGLSAEERELVEEGLAELDRGDVATEAQVRAVFDKYRT